MPPIFFILRIEKMVEFTRKKQMGKFSRLDQQCSGSCSTITGAGRGVLSGELCSLKGEIDQAF